MPVIGAISETLDEAGLEEQLHEAMWALSEDRTLGEAAGVLVLHGGYVARLNEEVRTGKRGLFLRLADGSEFKLTITKVR